MAKACLLVPVISSDVAGFGKFGELPVLAIYPSDSFYLHPSDKSKNSSCCLVDYSTHYTHIVHIFSTHCLS